MTTHSLDRVEQAAALADSIDALVFCAAANGDIKLVNRTLRERLGYQENQLLTRRFQDIVTPTQQPRVVAHLQSLFSGGTLGVVHMQFVAADGGVVDVEGSLTRAAVPGEPSSALGLFVERKPAAKAPFTVPVGRPVSLTVRQQAVLQLFATGHTTKQVANELDIAVKTVHNHLTTIYRLLDAQSLVQATMIAAQLGLVELAAPMR